MHKEDKATITNFKASLNTSVLHIATHGFLTSDGHNTNGLVLSKEDRSDGILTVEDIKKLDMSSVKLAVLSACNSGVTSSSQASIAQAFLKAGCKNVVYTTDYIDDEITKEFFTRFYVYYQDFNNISLAFRRSFLETLEHVGTPKPSFFILAGI